MNYTLLAYKPDSSDYCRNCHMASYSSDFQAYIQLTRDELVEKMAKLSAVELDTNEEGYRFTVLVNFKGNTVSLHDENDLNVGSVSLPDEIEEDSDFKAIELEFEEIKKEEGAKRALIILERKNKEEAEARAEAEQDRLAKERRDKAEFERLRLQFEGNK